MLHATFANQAAGKALGLLSNACHFDLRQIILISALTNGDVYIIAACKVLNSRSVHLSWDPLPLALQNGIIRQYKVTLVDSTGQARVINTTITSVTIAALAPFTSFNFTVAAETIALGPSTSPLQILTPQDGKH